MLLDRKKKKPTEGTDAKTGKVEYASREQDNSQFRLLGSWKAGEFK